MKRKLVSKRFFALILAVAMIVTIIPVTALAGDSTPADAQTEYTDDKAGIVSAQEGETLRRQ